MVYIIVGSVLVLLIAILYILQCIYNFNLKTRGKYSYLFNSIYQLSLKPYIHIVSDDFIKMLLIEGTSSIKDDEFYIVHNKLNYKLQVHNRLVILEHLDFNANIIESKFISVEARKLIKSTKNKLT